MKRILILACFLLVGAALPMRPAIAQAPAVQVISGTTPISAELRLALETFLNAYPPTSAPYYAPTYVEDHGAFSYVSLAALNLASADEQWSMEAGDDGAPSKVVWIGTLKINLDGTGEMVSTTPGPDVLHHLAVFSPPAPGGSASVRWPFSYGKAMQYGPRLIHGSGDYGTSGMNAVDLVGGTSLGTNVASDTIFASATGTVDYVCSDDTSVAVRTHNASTDDYFVYAHLLDNANLTMSHAFSAGGAIGALKHGSFNDTCGWADQGDTIYHVHWMFEPANGSFRVSQCTLTFSDKKFHCGTSVVGSGGWLTNNSAGTGGDDPVGSYVPSIWDNIVQAIVNFAIGTSNLLPSHNSPGDLLRGITNTIVLFFRLAWVLMRSNLNLAPVAVIILFLFGTHLVFGAIYLVFWIIRVIRLIKQTIAF